MAETLSPARLRRGDTSPSRPGMLFWRIHRGREIWVTPIEANALRLKKNTMAKKAMKRPENIQKRRLRDRDYSKTPQRRKFLAEYQRKNRRKYSDNRKAARMAYKKMRLATDPLFRLKAIIGNRIRSGMKRQCARKQTKTIELLGCTFEFFRGWLESQFTDGMTWKNYGSGDGQWQIEHTKPIALFDLSDKEQQAAAFHYTNCKPLWAAENHAKNDFITHNGQRVRARDIRNIIQFAVA